MRLFNNKRGDTILEVLIVMAVLSLVLTVSLAITNRSTQGNRQAQERGEAFKRAESQLELLKKYLSQTQTPVLPAASTGGVNFCMKDDGSPPVVISQPIPADAQNDNFTAFNDPGVAACKQFDGGGEYYVYINRDGSKTNTFTAHVRWYKVGGDGIDEATMVHRTYPELASPSSDGGFNSTACNAPFEELNAVGGCVPCKNGYASPSATTVNGCQPIPPRIIVTVKKIEPNPGNQTPACSKTATGNRAGTSVRLYKAGYNANSATDTASEALFTNLDLNSDYNAAVTAPPGYELCSPPSSPQSVTSGGLGPRVAEGTTTRPSQDFKIRPLCTTEPVYGWVNRGYWTNDGPRIAFWYTAHEGSGLHANLGNPYYPGNGQYWTRDGRFDQGKGGLFYNYWRDIYRTVYDQPVYHPNTVYEQVGTKAVCPA